MKLLIFVGILQVLRFDFKKFRILEMLNFHPCHVEYFYVLHSSSIFILVICSIPVKSMYIVFTRRVENSVDPDQMASSEAI